MFDKIGDAAEKLATNIGESRRGFLARLGQAAVGAAVVIGGALALAGAAPAISRITHGCQVTANGGGVYFATGGVVCLDTSTVADIFGNTASTSNNDIFGVFTIC